MKLVDSASERFFFAKRRDVIFSETIDLLCLTGIFAIASSFWFSL
jgi:hypothetical protein